MTYHRSIRAIVAAALVPTLLVAPGCGLLAPITGSPTPGTAGFLSVAQVAPTPPITSAQSAPVRVRLRNPSAFDATARITMRVGGVIVLLNSNRVPAGADSILVGPDSADSVLVELFIATNPPQTPAPRVFFLGSGFFAGDTIDIAIDPNLPPTDDTDRPPPPPPPAPLAGRIEGLDADVKVAPGSVVQFDVVLDSIVSSAVVVQGFVDPDANPGDGDELLINPAVTGGVRTTVTWNTSGVAPALYSVFADVTDADRTLRIGPAAGRIRVNAAPSLVFDSPLSGSAYTIGQTFIVGWAGQDPDDDARITIQLDPDSELNGNEIAIRDNVSEDDINDRQAVVATATLPAGTYRVVGTISDGIGSSSAVGATVCLSERLLGAQNLAALGARLGTIRGLTAEAPPASVTNVALGMSVDIGRDVSGDGRTDLLVGDPYAIVTEPDVGDYVRGAAYYGESAAGAWGGERTVGELKTRLLTLENDSLFGMSVALAGGADAGSAADLIIGAPLWESDGALAAGVAHIVDGGFARNVLGGSIKVDSFFPPKVGGLTGFADFKLPGESLGNRVAAIGDLDGDGRDEIAVAATEFGFQSGRVAVIRGGSGIGKLPIDDLPFSQTMSGNIVHGAESADLAGYGLASAGDLLCTSSECPYDSVAVGAPGVSEDRGAVYVLAGSALWFKNATPSLADIGPDLPGVLLIGETPGDMAGIAVASGDVNGDGATDLIVGAPGYGNGRGRVYVIYKSEPLLAALNGPPLALASVGAALPGVVFDGANVGDLLGWAVGAGDTDADGAADVLMGAPNTGNGTGAAYLIYGSAALGGAHGLTALATCEFQGWSLAGDEPGSHLGLSVSLGDLTGDGRADVAIGAPGNAGDGGDVRGLLRLILSGGPTGNTPGDKPPPGTGDSGGVVPPGDVRQLP